MPSIDTQKEAAVQILQAVHSSSPETNAVVAGGLVRDIHFNREAQDIDVFMEMDLTDVVIDDELLESMFIGMICDAVEVEDIKVSENSAYIADNGISGVIHATVRYKGELMEVDLICVNSNPLEHIQQGFNCSLSLAWMDKDGNCHYDDNFMDTVKTKVIKWEFNKGIFNHQYVKKILLAFPDYKIDERQIGEAMRKNLA